MRYPRLFTKLFCEPVMITETAFSGLATVLIARMSGNVSPRAAATPEQLPDEGWLRNRKIAQASFQQARLDDVYSQDGDTAIITLDGVIDRHISQMDMDCYGGCDLADIDRALDVAASDPSVKNVILDFRSPGGSVVGVPETAQKVSNLAKTKNVYAFTDSLCASAAYYIASQASQIVCTPSSYVGSIGVYCALLDASGYYEKQGVKINFFKSGDLKGAGLDFKPLTENEAEMFQNRVEQLGAQFRDTVTAARPNIATSTMQGQCFMGSDAVGVHLADLTLQSLADLRKRI